jgi:hypothetical protein
VASFAGVFAAGCLFFAGAIVGVELRNGRFFWTCAFGASFETVAFLFSDLRSVLFHLRGVLLA